MIVQVFGHHVENVVEAFHSRGHRVYATSPDKQPLFLGPADLLIAFPPCKFLCSSGLHWNTRRPGRALQTLEALALVRKLMASPATRVCIENPVGCISSQIRRPNQIIHPYQFGHNASKKTCLWLKNLPDLRPTKHIAPRLVVTPRGVLDRWDNQYDDGQNTQGWDKNRGVVRGERWQGIADAMAEQWGIL